MSFVCLCIKRKTKAAIPDSDETIVFLVSECACAAYFACLLGSEKCGFWVLHPFGTHWASIRTCSRAIMESTFLRPLKDLVKFFENVCSPSSCKKCMCHRACVASGVTGQPCFSVCSPRCDHQDQPEPTFFGLTGWASIWITSAIFLLAERGRVVFFFNFK